MLIIELPGVKACEHVDLEVNHIPLRKSQPKNWARYVSRTPLFAATALHMVLGFVQCKRFQQLRYFQTYRVSYTSSTAVDAFELRKCKITTNTFEFIVFFNLLQLVWSPATTVFSQRVVSFNQAGVASKCLSSQFRSMEPDSLPNGSTWLAIRSAIKFAIR